MLSTLTVTDPGFGSSFFCKDFSRLSHTIDLKIGAPAAALPDAWHYRVSPGTGWPGVSILWLGEIDLQLTISVWQHMILSEQICPWDTLACCWDVKQPTNNDHFSRDQCFFYMDRWWYTCLVTSMVLTLTSWLPGVSGDNVKHQNQFLYRLNWKWLNFVLKMDLLTVFLAVDRINSRLSLTSGFD